MTETNRRIVLRRRPVGMPVPDDFAFEEVPVPEPAEGEVVLKHLYLSLDPYQRGRLSEAKSYAAPVPIGGVVECRAVGRVLASRDGRFAPGDVALGGFGWQTHSVMPGRQLLKLDPAEAPVSTALGVLGMPGLTAHVGMSDIGQPKKGETVVVSAASGAVGAVAGQLARLAGCRVVGIAGGAEKCRFVIETLGFDAAIDHRAEDLAAALDRTCPDGIDVYWENVGGAVQAAVFPRLNDFARMVMCGMIAQYNDADPPPGPNLGPVVRKRLRIQGFIVSDQWHRLAEWRALAAPMLRDGRLRHREDVVEGLEATPAAFIGLLQGRNFGKLLVRLPE
ncbi:NADP-dependent oxidoreductase [Elioraea sp. Yellowstone]|jgi:NADPH-dependent curcumin reductase CurA|uniref:NADP-dependent oxidoreductase n=1 Tax=Elioraea sp. Yellowstone TaxID=2592070 RepID=UPI0011527E01|nr:NADP-dependent oxidoreductase [Elioraea sp. Yellowstone]TQF82782.1 NADP-dependent oxidoreductase [Elioraea sp. Yellowstone]